MKYDNNKEKQKHMHKLNTTLETLNSKHLQNIIIYIDQPLKFTGFKKENTTRTRNVDHYWMKEGRRGLAWNAYATELAL